MWHFQTDYCNPNPAAGNNSLYCLGNFLAYRHQMSGCCLRHIVPVINLSFWNHQKMALANRLNGHNGNTKIIFPDKMSGDLPVNYFSENTCHARYLQIASGGEFYSKDVRPSCCNINQVFIFYPVNSMGNAVLETTWRRIKLECTSDTPGKGVILFNRKS